MALAEAGKASRKGSALLPACEKGCLQEMKTFDVEMGSLQHSYPLSGGSYDQATVLRDNDGEGDSLIPPPALAHSLGKTKRL